MWGGVGRSASATMRSSRSSAADAACTHQVAVHVDGTVPRPLPHHGAVLDPQAARGELLCSQAVPALNVLHHHVVHAAVVQGQLERSSRVDGHLGVGAPRRAGGESRGPAAARSAPRPGNCWRNGAPQRKPHTRAAASGKEEARGEGNTCARSSAHRLPARELTPDPPPPHRAAARASNSAGERQKQHPSLRHCPGAEGHFRERARQGRRHPARLGPSAPNLQWSVA